MDVKNKFNKPYILKSVLFGAIIFFIALLMLFFKFNIAFISIYIILAFLFSASCIHFFVQFFAKHQNHRYLLQFKTSPGLNAYQKGISRTYACEKKYDHFVLLLHGFSTSPYEMANLTDALEEQNIPYSAPMLPGFGLTDTNLLEKLRYQDLFRFALLQYDMLTNISKKVSIVAHSMGAVLATYVAQKRSVHQLVLTAPALYFFPEDKPITTLLTKPGLSDIFTNLIPYIPKTAKKSSQKEPINPQVEYKRLQYLSVPSHAVKNILLARRIVDIQKIQPTNLSIVYGDKDHIVNMKKCLAIVENANISHKIYRIKNMAHNLFEEPGKDEAINAVISCLKHQKD